MLNGIWWSELEHSVFILEIIPRPTNSSAQSSHSDQTETDNAILHCCCVSARVGRRQDLQDMPMLMITIFCINIVLSMSG